MEEWIKTHISARVADMVTDDPEWGGILSKEVLLGERLSELSSPYTLRLYFPRKHCAFTVYYDENDQRPHRIRNLFQHLMSKETRYVYRIEGCIGFAVEEDQTASDTKLWKELEKQSLQEHLQHLERLGDWNIEEKYYRWFVHKTNQINMVAVNSSLFHVYWFPDEPLFFDYATIDNQTYYLRVFDEKKNMIGILPIDHSGTVTNEEYEQFFMKGEK